VGRTGQVPGLFVSKHRSLARAPVEDALTLLLDRLHGRPFVSGRQQSGPTARGYAHQAAGSHKRRLAPVGQRADDHHMSRTFGTPMIRSAVALVGVRRGPRSALVPAPPGTILAPEPRAPRCLRQRTRSPTTHRPCPRSRAFIMATTSPSFGHCNPVTGLGPRWSRSASTAFVECSGRRRCWQPRARPGSRKRTSRLQSSPRVAGRCGLMTSSVGPYYGHRGRRPRNQGRCLPNHVGPRCPPSRRPGTLSRGRAPPQPSGGRHASFADGRGEFLSPRGTGLWNLQPVRRSGIAYKPMRG